MGSATAKLWTCPECGHRFVTKNMWHSCSNYSLEHHFDNASDAVRGTFERLLEVIAESGPVTVIPQKTRIAIQAEVRFAHCIVRRKWLLANLWLTREVEHRRLQRREEYGPRSVGHRFRLNSASDIDAEFRELVAESYRVGVREHLRR